MFADPKAEREAAEAPEPDEQAKIKRVLSLIQDRFRSDGIEINEMTHPSNGGVNTVIYNAVIKNIHGKDESIAQIQLLLSKETTVAEYLSPDRWHGPRNEYVTDAILVTWLKSTKSGYGSLMLAYGVLNMKLLHPGVLYIVLDDDTDRSVIKTRNIYSLFGFTPIQITTPKNNKSNEVVLNGPEKQAYVKEFIIKAFKKYSHKVSKRSNVTNRPRSRSRSRNRQNRYQTRSITRSKNSNGHHTRSNA